VVAAISRVLLGKTHQVKLALACLLARGHLLIEDLPGTGKTTLAEALARCFRLDFRRVSFTSDLLPADLTGFTSSLDRSSARCCWLMRSTGPPPAPRAPCWRPWRRVG
jgi:MoxR-like ATPase